MAESHSQGQERVQSGFQSRHQMLFLSLAGTAVDGTVLPSVRSWLVATAGRGRKEHARRPRILLFPPAGSVLHQLMERQVRTNPQLKQHWLVSVWPEGCRLKLVGFDLIVETLNISGG